jgi:hypothetical protein
MSRREAVTTLTKVAIGSVASIAAIAGTGYYISTLKSTIEYLNPTTATSVRLDPFPLGNRVVRIRILNDDQSWTNAMGHYTTGDVLDWLEDLKPTTLNRFFSGPQDPKQILPAPPGKDGMTVQEFLQACVDACADPSSTTLFPRLSYTYDVDDGESHFLELAQQMLDLCVALDPAQTLLSIDWYQGKSSEIASLADKLFAMGWTGLAWGPCGSKGPKGYATFAMICADPLTGQPNLTNMQSLRDIGGYGEFEVQIDFPTRMAAFAAQSPDRMADILKTMALGQSQEGYHLMYPIFQGKSAQSTSTFRWDSTQIFTSSSGQYHGQSLYQVMKSLMVQYNP